MSNEQPNSEPADLSDFTPEERALARTILLEIRAGHPVSLPAGLISFKTGESTEWCWTEEGGKARHVPCTTTTSSHDGLHHRVDLQSNHDQAGPWFPCPRAPKNEPPPEPDISFGSGPD